MRMPVAIRTAVDRFANTASPFANTASPIANTASPIVASRIMCNRIMCFVRTAAQRGMHEYGSGSKQVDELSHGNGVMFYANRQVRGLDTYVFPKSRSGISCDFSGASRGLYHYETSAKRNYWLGRDYRREPSVSSTTEWL